MNEQPNSNSSPKITDDQMDGMLTAFFDAEVPDKLSVPPSQWPELQIVPLTTEQAPRRFGRRALTVAGTVAAACLMVLLVANPFSSEEVVPGPEVAAEQPGDQNPLDSEATVNVSNGESGLAIDDANTTLQEIDSIDLSPGNNEDDNKDEGTNNQDSK